MISEILEAAKRTLRDLRQAQQLSRAGSALGQMRLGYRRNRGRSKPKRWTGFLDGAERAWYGRKVFLPDETLGSICAVLRGQAVARWDDPTCIEGVRFGLFKAADLRPYKSPAAILLGKAKAGKTERRSELKAATARANGRMPCKPGKRRGRPSSALPSSG